MDRFIRAAPRRRLAAAGFVVLGLFAGASARAAVPAVNPQSGSVGLTGTVRGAAPATSAVITSPVAGQRFSSLPVTVAGQCPIGTFVVITKNGDFAGAVDCSATGAFNLAVDLLPGANRLVARVTDALGQYGPDSAPVTVNYDAPTVAVPGGVVGAQLALAADAFVAASNPGAASSRQVRIVGGVGPYAVSWDWGDGTTSLTAAGAAGVVAAGHDYARAGTYRVIVRVTDATGNAAYLQLVAVVNGLTATAVASDGTVVPDQPVGIWPALVVTGLIVVTFWIGELARRRRLARLEYKAYVGMTS